MKIFVKNKWQKRIVLLFLLFCISIRDIKPAIGWTVGLLEVAEWVVRAKCIEFVCAHVSGANIAFLANNIIDIVQGVDPSLEVSKGAVNAVSKQAAVQDSIVQSSMAVTSFAQNKVNLAPLLSVAKQTALPQVGTIATTVVDAESARSLLSNVHWDLGKSAAESFRAEIFSKVTAPPSMSDAVTVTFGVDGQTTMLNRGTTGLTFHVDLNTRPDERVARFYATIAEDVQKIQQCQALTQYTQLLQKDLAVPVERLMAHTIEHGVSASQAIDTIRTMQGYGLKAQQALACIEQDALSGRCSQAVLQGARGVVDNVQKTIRYVEGSLCNVHGNIVGMQSFDQKKLFAKVYGNHCRRMGYPTHIRNQKCSFFADQRLLNAAKSDSFHIPLLQDTAYNRDLIRVVNFVKGGYSEHASALIEKYNPAHFNRLSNWWHDRGTLYNAMKGAHQEVTALYCMSDGLLSVYQEHPMWHELYESMRQSPSLKEDIVAKLRNEHAFSLQVSEQMGIVQPSPEQMQKLYRLCQYSYLTDFQSQIDALSSVRQLDSLLGQFEQDHCLLQGVRSRISCMDDLWQDLLSHQELLKQTHLDPTFDRLLQSLHEQPHAINLAVEALQARLHAANILLDRCCIQDPEALTRILSYHLVDNFHQPGTMMDYLAQLDPHHADPMVRAAYTDFFDADGVQKLVPLNDQVCALFQDRLRSIDLHMHPEQRAAFNRLALCNVDTPGKIDVVNKGFSYIEHACSQQPHASFMREYAPAYVRALTTPDKAHASILSMSKLVDTYTMPMPSGVKKVFGQQLTKLFDSTISSGVSQEELKKLLHCLTGASAHIQAHNMAAAQDLLLSIPHDGLVGLRDKKMATDALSRFATDLSPEQSAAIAPQASMPIEIARASSSSAPSSATQSLVGGQDALTSVFGRDYRSGSFASQPAKSSMSPMETGLVTAATVKLLNGASSLFRSAPPVKETRNEQMLAWFRRQERLERLSLGDDKGKGKSSFDSAISLLEQGALVAQVADGVLVQLDDGAYAYVAPDGSSQLLSKEQVASFAASRVPGAPVGRDVLYMPSRGFSDARPMAEPVSKDSCRQLREQSSGGASSSSSVGERFGQDELAALLADFKKRSKRNNGAQQPVKPKGASVACGGGGGEPPDPRDPNGKDKQYPGDREPELGRKLKSEETILRRFHKVKGRKVKGAQLYKYKKRYYHLDTFHTGSSAHLEAYDIAGRHLGEASPITGKIIAGTIDLTKRINIK